MFRVEALRSTGSWGTVMAWRSTTQKKVSEHREVHGGVRENKLLNRGGRTRGIYAFKG